MSSNLMGIGGIGAVVSFILFIVCHISPTNPIMAGYALYFSVFFALTWVYGTICDSRNWFHKQKESINTAKASISIYKRQKEDLEKELRNLLKQLMENDKSLIEAVKGRSAENLKALLEGYPDLKGNTTIESLINKLVDLRKTISEKESAYNGTLRTLIAKTKSSPDNCSLLMPAEFKSHGFKYINNGETESEKE